MDSIQPTVTRCLVNQRRFERKNVLVRRAFIVLYLYYKSNKRNKCEKCKSRNDIFVWASCVPLS